MFYHNPSKSMKHRFTTIFLVSNDNAETKFYTVKTKHVEKLKSYVKTTAIALSVLLLSLVLLVVLLKVDTQHNVLWLVMRKVIFFSATNGDNNVPVVAKSIHSKRLLI